RFSSTTENDGEGCNDYIYIWWNFTSWMICQMGRARKDSPDGFVTKPETLTDGIVKLMIWHRTIPSMQGPDGPNKIHPDVDLTAPDAGRPNDDPAWFCLRVGCDQSHEQVDPEALDRSFFMRVCYGGEKPQREATKAIDRKNQSSMLKCLHSAPPKRPRAQFARLSAETEAAGKAPAEPKPRVERICAMRASPIHTKTARKKQSAQIDVTAQQLGEPRPAFNNGIQRKAVEPERVSRAASSTRTTKPA
ncbi:hypothetical protein ACJX0J_038151, partial [Zea mays]